MVEGGERLIIAATLDDVYEGQTLHGLPVHMPILDGFSIDGDRRRTFLTNAMDQVFRGQSSLKLKSTDELVSGRRLLFNQRYQTYPRVLENVSPGPRHGFRSLARGLGSLAEADLPEKDGYIPNIVDTKEYRLKPGESISFSSVALMALGDNNGRVEASILKSIQLENLDTDSEKFPITNVMVASTFDDVEVGQVFESLPPHLTVFPWATMDGRLLEEFSEGIAEIVLENRAPVPTGGSRKLFGDDESIAVRRLDRATSGFNVVQDFFVHAAVFGLVNRLGGVYDPKYVGLNYAPHISDSPQRSVAEDEVFRLDNLTVFQKDLKSRNKRVRAVHHFRKGAAE